MSIETKTIIYHAVKLQEKWVAIKDHLFCGFLIFNIAVEKAIQTIWVPFEGLLPGLQLFTFGIVQPVLAKII